MLTAGDGNDRLVGGRGNDQLFGGAGLDTYQYNSGDGSDIIFDGDGGEGNRLIFGSGIAANDLTLEVSGVSFLSIHIGAANDRIQISDFNPLNLSVAHSLESFEFTTGLCWTMPNWLNGVYLLASQLQSNVINGSGFNDLFFGGPYNDTFFGGGGNDQAYGGGGFR